MGFGIVHEGRLLIEDSMAGLRRRLANQQRLTIKVDQVAPTLIERLAAAPYIAQVQQEGRQLHLQLRTPRRRARANTQRLISEAGGVIVKMQGDEMSLEEAFVTITSQDVLALAGQPGHANADQHFFGWERARGQARPAAWPLRWRVARQMAGPRSCATRCSAGRSI